MSVPEVEKIALSMLDGMTAASVRFLAESDVSYAEFFKLDKAELVRRLHVSFGFDDMKRQEALFRAREELNFITKHKIKAFFLMDDNYPLLLKEIPDAPIMLYAVGSGDLNSEHAISVVGTRRCTSYGLNFTRSLVTDLAAYLPDLQVYSGLAYGIDAAAHTASLEAGVKTIAVVAHGLDTIYPAAHRDLARRIVEAGGSIVSEYPSKVRSYRQNFLERNRIIAGLSEVTIVAESEVKGGAMSTANQAFSYSREVVAVPGRVTDITSGGCNSLIARQKAHIFTSVPDLMAMMNWKIPLINASVPTRQGNLFPELEGDAAAVYRYLHEKGAPASIDELHTATHLVMAALMPVLTELEFDGVITKLPGSRYELS